jgi:hypothetical protein
MNIILAKEDEHLSLNEELATHKSNFDTFKGDTTSK